MSLVQLFCLPPNMHMFGTFHQWEFKLFMLLYHTSTKL